jgi:hypothetical protein
VHGSDPRQNYEEGLKNRFNLPVFLPDMFFLFVFMPALLASVPPITQRLTIVTVPPHICLSARLSSPPIKFAFNTWPSKLSCLYLYHCAIFAANFTIYRTGAMAFYGEKEIYLKVTYPAEIRDKKRVRQIETGQPEKMLIHV